MLKKIILSVIVITLILQFACLSFAATNSQISELNEKINEAQEQKAEVKSQLSSAVQDVQNLATSIEENENKLQAINSQLVQLNKEIKALTEELEKTEKEYTEQEDFLKEKLVMDFENGKATYLDVLLNSKSILDFISKYYLVSEVLQNDNDLLDSIEEKKNKIEQDKTDLEDKQREVKNQKAEQEKIKVVLANQKTQKESKISELTEQEKKISSDIDAYKADVRKIEAQLTSTASNASSSGKIYTGGQFLWPCPNYSRITSPYGYRICPYHGRELHSGIDMAAPYGSAILAAADGQVITAGWVNSYGYTVMIYHGSGLTTIYAHCSSILVSVGQSVSRGDTVAKVGSTGDSTGNHLHFGVKLNGSYTSPNPYLGM